MKNQKLFILYSSFLSNLNYIWILFSKTDNNSDLQCCFGYWKENKKEFKFIFVYLPGRNLAISAHLFPYFLWASKMIFSSVLVHGSLLILGSRWLCHLSLHCLPDLPLREKTSSIFWATMVHLLIPNLFTNSIMAWSS